MKLILNCKKCRNQIKLTHSVNDRGELARETGDDFKRKCPECSAIRSYHVNEVIAQESRLIAVIAFMILLLGTAVIFFYLKDFLLRPNNPYNVLLIAGLLLIPSLIYMVLKKQELKNVKLLR